MCNIKKRKRIDIITSCYNEEGNIKLFYNEIIKHLNIFEYNYNILFINDGSTDNTYNEIKTIANTKDKPCEVSYISFIKNYGHEAAMCAGIDHSFSEYKIFMDVDLQNPPDLIEKIILKLEEGCDCVLMKKKHNNEKTNSIKKIFSKLYYFISKYAFRNKIERDVSDFFAINNILAEVIKCKYNTRLRFLRNFIQKEASHVGIINYDVGERKIGKSRYSYFKLIKLAVASEFSRSKFVRDVIYNTHNKPVYEIDYKKTFISE